MSRSRPPFGRASVGTGVVLMAVGAVLAFAVDVPAEVEEYVDVLDLGLILVWAGVLVLVMQVVMHRVPRANRLKQVIQRLESAALVEEALVEHLDSLGTQADEPLPMPGRDTHERAA